MSVACRLFSGTVVQLWGQLLCLEACGVDMHTELFVFPGVHLGVVAAAVLLTRPQRHAMQGLRSNQPEQQHLQVAVLGGIA